MEGGKIKIWKPLEFAGALAHILVGILVSLGGAKFLLEMLFALGKNPPSGASGVIGAFSIAVFFLVLIAAGIFLVESGWTLAKGREIDARKRENAALLVFFALLLMCGAGSLIGGILILPEEDAGLSVVLGKGENGVLWLAGTSIMLVGGIGGLAYTLRKMKRGG